MYLGTYSLIKRINVSSNILAVNDFGGILWEKFVHFQHLKLKD